jgi:hypothetical protein
VIQQTPSERRGYFAMAKKLRRDPVSIRAARPGFFAREKTPREHAMGVGHCCRLSGAAER